jgi:hypothetical protein
MSGRISKDCPEFGVPFVVSLARRRPGKAIRSPAAALRDARWLVAGSWRTDLSNRKDQ